VLRKADWTGPEKLFEPIFNALHNDKTVRPKDGNEFFQQIEQAPSIITITFDGVSPLTIGAIDSCFISCMVITDPKKVI
jgi:hypothetical protein